MLGAQTQSFETATIKLQKTVPDLSGPRQQVRTTPNSVTIQFASLGDAIAWAYNVQPPQITGVGLPQARYDFAGKAAGKVTKDELRAMMQKVLVEQFHLELRRESKTMTVFALTVNKESAGKDVHLEPADSDVDMSAEPKPPATIFFEHTTMAELAGILSAGFEAPVIDETGLKGAFKFKIDYASFVGRALVNDNGLSGEGAVFFQAVPEQLGIKIEKRKAPVDVLVIDHWQKPPEN
jgi:uncharacterized protein (TIGR03435 family)